VHCGGLFVTELFAFVSSTAHVQELLEVYSKTDLSGCLTYLRHLPRVSPIISKLGPRALLQRFHQGLLAVGNSSTTGADAITLCIPYWLCHDYRLCVLCEAMSFSSSLPAVFYLDCFRSSAMSLLNKDVHVSSSGYESKMRPWLCGVADPGTGKSHAADPHVALVEEVCRAHEAYAPGTADDYFHIIYARTYAAFEDKMTATRGYGLLVTGEGHTLLSPSYPSRGVFDDQKGLRFDKMMDVAYGGKFGGETKTDREKAQRAKRKGDVVAVPFQSSSNVCLALIVQDSVWISWFVLAEYNHHEGLASRFLIAFANGRMVGPLRYKDFFHNLYRPVMKSLFKSILSTYAPRKDVLDKEDPIGRFWFRDAEERFIKNARKVAKTAEPDGSSGKRKFTTGLQKCGYWIPGIAWETRLCNGLGSMSACLN
jgi:hypothetical protein